MKAIRLNTDYLSFILAGFLAAVLAVCLTLLLPVSAISDEDGASEATPSELRDLGIEGLLDVKVVSASKRLETASQAPASVVVITQEDIWRYGYRNLGEALRRVVGFYAFSDRNYDYIGVRGFARPGDYNTRVLLLIDGHRMNDPLYDMAAIGEDLTVDIESVDRIEIVKGPGSSLWGTNALLAVVNIITKKGPNMRGSRAVGEYGTFSRSKIYVEHGVATENGLAANGSVSSLASDGQSSLYFPEFDDPSTNNGIAEDIDGEKARRGYLTASYGHLTLLANSGSRRKQVPTASWGGVFNDDNTFTVDSRQFVELNYESNLGGDDSRKAMFRLYHDRSGYRGRWTYDYGYPELVVNEDFGSASWWGAEARCSFDLTPRLSATAGLEYQNTYKLHQRNYDKEPYYEYMNISNSFRLFSVYAQTELRLNGSLRLIGGLRSDDYSTFGRAWSPRAALIYNPSSSNSLKLLYGKAFRAPNDYERNYEVEDVQHGNDNLRPENITTYEFVWERALGKFSRVVTSVFRFDLDDIVTQISAPDGLPQFQNAGAVRSQGIEVAMESRFQNGLTGYMGFGVQRAEDRDTGDVISNSSRSLATAGVSIPVFSRKAHITPEWQYLSSRKTLSGESAGVSALTNLTIATGSFQHGFTAALSVYNLFDRKVYTPGGAELTQDRIPQDGRTVRLRLSRWF